MKFIFACFLVVAVVSATPRDLCTKNDKHSISMGTCGQDKLYEQTVLIEGTTQPYPIENREMIFIPESGAFDAAFGCIHITNLMNEIDGGCPYLDMAGDKKSATVQLISQRGKDMKFHIEVFKA